MGGWQEYSLVDAGQPRRAAQGRHQRAFRCRPTSARSACPASPAWYGLMKIMRSRSRAQTVVVSAASGAVGSVVGQLAKARGCRAVGIAGGADKCAYVDATSSASTPASTTRRTPISKSLYAGAEGGDCPDGIDGYFENVGGMILDAVLRA